MIVMNITGSPVDNAFSHRLFSCYCPNGSTVGGRPGEAGGQGTGTLMTGSRGEFYVGFGGPRGRQKGRQTGHD